MYKAILINPKEKTVTEVTLNEEDTLKSMYQHMECELVTIAGYIPGGVPGQEDTVFADDEGLFKEEKHFSMVDGITGPVAGNMLVVGCSDEGDTISPQYTSLEEIAHKVKFLTLDEILAMMDRNPEVGVLELE